MRISGNGKRLSGQHFEEFYYALVDAFDRNSFKRMLRIRLKKRLGYLDHADNFREMLFGVIEHADEEDWSAELLQAALEERPQNVRLNVFAKNFTFVPDSILPLPINRKESLVEDKVANLPFNGTPLQFPNKNSLSTIEEQKAVSNRTQVFISYSHKDTKYLDGLLPHLEYLGKNNFLDFWVDTKIKPGEKWHTEIELALASAQVAILLISVDFLISQFILDNELPPLLAAAEAKGVKILSVILRPCILPPSLSQFQAVNSPSKPLSKMKGFEREDIWVKVAKAVEKSM